MMGGNGCAGGLHGDRPPGCHQGRSHERRHVTHGAGGQATGHNAGGSHRSARRYETASAGHRATTERRAAAGS